MNATPPALDLRIRRLERTCRRARRTSLAAVTALLAVLSAGWTLAPQTVDEVTAKGFTLVDDAGQPRGRWTMRDGSPHLELLDSKGVPRIAVFYARGAANIVLRDTGKRSRLALSVDHQGHPHGIWMDEGQVPRIHASVGNAGLGNLQMLAEDGAVPVGFGIMPDGSPWLRPSEDHEGGDWGRRLEPPAPAAAPAASFTGR